jgi:hypothetical protein
MTEIPDSGKVVAAGAALTSGGSATLETSRNAEILGSKY